MDNPLIQSVILNVRDITERKNAEDALIESKARLSELNATKDRFFSIIAHDLKSPFNSIFGFSELLVEQMNRKDYQGVEKFAAIINRSSKQAMDLLTNLLEWARAQTGKIEFNPEYIELVTLINEVAELFNDSAQQKAITIIKDLPHNLPVFADKYMIGTVLRNLISNGIKFTHPGGKIRVSAKQNENQVTVSVSDNGVGIEKETIDKLFRIEYSYSTTGTASESGTGLGLLLCKEFIEMHGGKIWVESEPEKGSVFLLTLPIA
ncbi:sensor histidine kinase [Prolixibacter bellariivorans]|uniref:sensor histidine kinase n=1 Tax=Prolixibacter bellariivorans TaxID=314319 RepID=UPI003570F2D5